MVMRRDSQKWLLLLLHHLLLLSTISHRVLSLNSATAICEFSITDRNKLYNFNLASPIRKYPHGVLSEDGFYKVEVNETVLWFQLCDVMVFNHDPPRCIDCLGCGGGGPSHCGMDCSALVANDIGGYPVCTTIARASSVSINIIDREKPDKGVIVKMSNSGQAGNCSLTVSIICDENGAQGLHTLNQTGNCDYATELKHPSGCAEIANIHAHGWGWFSTFMLIIFCLFGAYLLAGAIYRRFFLGIRGIDVIPNLEFWTSLPRRTQSFFASWVRRFRGPSQGYRTSYSSVNF